MTDYLKDRDEEAEGVQSVYLMGEGDDCEYCGWSSDEGEFHLFLDGRFYLSTRYGCYGGNYTEDKAEVLAELAHCARFMDIDDEINQIKELLGV